MNLADRIRKMEIVVQAGQVGPILGQFWSHAECQRALEAARDRGEQTFTMANGKTWPLELLLGMSELDVAWERQRKQEGAN